MNKLSLNVNKTTCIIFTPLTKSISSGKTSINLQGTDIPFCNSTKFLGVIIDKNLTWQSHINFICNKIGKGVGIIIKLRSILPSYILKMIYNSIILPYISYCNIAWGGTYVSRLHNLFVLQNKAMRIITGTDISSHSRTAPLYYTNNCLNLFDIHKLQIGVFIHNWLNDRLPKIFSTLFSFRLNSHNHHTRYATNLSYPLFRLSTSQNTIPFSAPNFWNKLPHNLKQHTSLSSFKSNLKKFMLSFYN